jgi:hypothetical protein
VRRELLQYGSCRHTLTGGEPARALLTWVAGASTDLTVTLNFLRVMANPGAKVRRKLLGHLVALGLTGPEVELWSIESWLGVGGPRCLLRARAVPALADRVIMLAESVFWAYGRWEDLAFYRDDQVVYTCVSHEAQGQVYGSAEELRRLGLTAVPSAERWAVQAEPFDQDYTRALLAEAAGRTGAARAARRRR